MEGQIDDDYEERLALPRSWEDKKSYTIFAPPYHFSVVDVLVENGTEVKEGDPLLILEILNQQPPKSSTRSNQSDSEDSSESLQSKEAAADQDLDYAPANKKHKVNDIGQPKRVTLTARSSCLVAEVMVVKGMKVKPREPLYALKYADMQDYSKEAVDQMLLSNRKWLDELRQFLETYPLPAMTD